MRLKSYIADTMAEAMDMVRTELGDEAIIVSTQRAADGQGVRITAALEDTDTDAEVERSLTGAVTTPFGAQMREALEYHGTPARLTEKLVQTASAVEVGSATTACAAALAETFDFAPLPERKAPRPFVMVGPPGTGKTVVVAKLAARARLAGRPVGVISADAIRAGAHEQLAAFTDILGVELRLARDADTLRLHCEDMSSRYDLVFIDSPGLNPFSGQDMDYLANLTGGADVEPILVLAAGGDAEESAEIGEAFGKAGTTRLLATRLDMTRRLGAVLSAADGGQLMFSEASMSPHVASGLSPLTAMATARLILPPDEDLKPVHEDPRPAQLKPTDLRKIIPRDGA